MLSSSANVFIDTTCYPKATHSSIVELAPIAASQILLHRNVFTVPVIGLGYKRYMILSNVDN